MAGLVPATHAEPPPQRNAQRRAAIAVLAVKVKPPSAVASQELSEP
jgi:hypothetical protein